MAQHAAVSNIGSGNDTVQQIKDRLSIVEVVTPYVKLTRAGKYYRGLSPFGKEKTPSFYVSPDRGSYYCFSSSQGGDHFTFIEKMEGVDFKGALKILAEKAGVEIQKLRPEDKQRADARDRVREAMARAEQFFASGLADGSPAYAYAKERGLADETIRAWNLGVAPAGWRALLEHLGSSADGSSGYTTKELASAGLIKEADEKPGTWYDRFRNRLMFPIRDVAGRTVAFTGRALDASETAKYLNSPETDLYKKSEILFGMDKAKDAIRARGFAILVEGQFDLLLLHQAGFTNTIAISGTALTNYHLSLIKRYADNLMLALDADKAGLSAAARSAHAALSTGMRVKAVRLPQGKDPADVVSEEGGAATFAELVKNSQSIIEFFLGTIASQERDEFKLLRRVEETLLPLVAAVGSPLERNKYVEIIARALSQPPESVREALAKVRTAESTAGRAGGAADGRNADEQRDNGSRASQSGNYAGNAGREARNDSAPEPSKPLSALERRRGMVLAAIKAYPESGLAKRLKERYSAITEPDAPAFPESILSDLDERLLFEAEQVFGEAPSDEAGDELAKVFERMFLEDARTKASAELRRAETAGDHEGANAALKAIKELSARIHAAT